MSEETSSEHGMAALTPEQLKQAAAFFEQRLIGQPEAIQALTNVLYKQNALLKRVLEHAGDSERPVGIPADPTVLLLMGGSWGKSLITRLIPMALNPLGYGSLTVLTPLPQDPEGALNLEPQAVAAPFSTIVVENIETVEAINARFVTNLAHLIETGVVALIDPQQKVVQPIPLGLTTVIMTSSIADEEIREALNPESRLGFLRPAQERTGDAEELYQQVRRICQQALDYLPRDLLRHVDETVILRPLGESDLRQIFELEIAHYQQVMFPGQALTVVFEGEAQERLFDEAQMDLGLYGAHALRRVLQRYIDPVVYQAYNEGMLTEANLKEHHVIVGLEKATVSVRVE
jgi:ATP-dependent Clp protease ATP-binding subunit ClpA